MDISPSALKRQASDALKTVDHRKYVLIHTGAVLILSLFLQLVDFFLTHQANNTSGLSGIGTRGILNTVQTVLYLAQLVLLPLWELGYLFVTMGLSRRRQTDRRELLEGFRIALPGILLTLLEFLIYFGLALAASYLGSILFTLSPLSHPLQEALLPYMNSSTVDMAAMEQAMMTAIEQAIVPIMVFFLLAALVIVAPMYYRLRLCRYVLLDDPGCGAMFALRMSRQLMRGNCRKLLKLDLSFWWYYALELIATGVYLFDMVLELFGITLPGPAALWMLLALALYAVCELAIHCRFRNHVFVTYAGFYDTLRQEDADPQAPLSIPVSDFE